MDAAPDPAPAAAPERVSGWVARWAPLVPAGEVLDLACGRGRHARLFAALGHDVVALDRDAAALESATQPVAHDVVARDRDAATQPVAHDVVALDRDPATRPVAHDVVARDRDPAALVGWTGPPSTRSTGCAAPETRAAAPQAPAGGMGGKPAPPTGASVFAGVQPGRIVPMRHDLEAEGAPWPFAPGRFAGIVVTNYLHRPLMAQLLASLAPNGVLIYETFALGNEAYGKPSNPAFLLAPGELLAHAAAAGLRVLAYEDGLVARPKPALVQRLCAAGPACARADARLDQLSGRNEP